MLDTKNSEKKSYKSTKLNQLLFAIESASHDTSLLALNMALEGASAGASSAAQLASAVGELSIRANQFSHQIRGCLKVGSSKLDSRSLSEVRRVTRGVAELIGEVSGLAGGLLKGIIDPLAERAPEVSPDLLDQVRSRANELDRLFLALPDAARDMRHASTEPGPVRPPPQPLKRRPAREIEPRKRFR